IEPQVERIESAPESIEPSQALEELPEPIQETPQPVADVPTPRPLDLASLGWGANQEHFLGGAPLSLPDLPPPPPAFGNIGVAFDRSRALGEEAEQAPAAPSDESAQQIAASGQALDDDAALDLLESLEPS